MDISGTGVPIPYFFGAVGESGDGGDVTEAATVRRRCAAAGDAAAAEIAMAAPEVDMASVRFPTIIVFYLSEFRGSEGSLRYHVRGFETVKKL